MSEQATQIPHKTDTTSAQSLRNSLTNITGACCAAYFSLITTTDKAYAPQWIQVLLAQETST